MNGGCGGEDTEFAQVCLGGFFHGEHFDLTFDDFVCTVSGVTNREDMWMS